MTAGRKPRGVGHSSNPEYRWGRMSTQQVKIALASHQKLEYLEFTQPVFCRSAEGATLKIWQALADLLVIHLIDPNEHIAVFNPAAIRTLKRSNNKGKK